MSDTGSEIVQEQYYQIAIGQGMQTSELASNIPDGFSAVCYNLVATGDSLENRIGIRRPSVDWKVLDSAPTAPMGTAATADDYNFFETLFPWEGDSSKPAFGWGAVGRTVPGSVLNSPSLSFVRAAGATDANDGFMSVTLPQACIGIAQYQDVVYFSMAAAGGIQKITNFNWAADSITYSAVASAAGGTLRGLFTFKDRMWAWGTGVSSHKLYFTDLPSVGGQPETWALAANFISFVGPNGRGRIESVVPLGNKLVVFTTNGLFTLLVEGAPASWILRILDSKSVSTCSQCAFESKGVIYYINTQGVWATNALSVTKISMAIDDQFFLSKGARIHTICQYEDGMIISIAKQTTNPINLDRDNCKTFYSKLDPMGWTEWNINSYELGLERSERLGYIWSVTDKIPTYLNTDPTVYVMGFITDSTEAVKQYSVGQLLIMDGGQDVYVDRTNTIRTSAMGLYLKTKHFDGGNPYRIKKAVMGMLEIYTSDVEHNLTTSWDLDTTIDADTEIQSININEFTVGLNNNFARIRADFRYRRASFNLRAELQTNTSQIKIKDIAIAQIVGRSEPELIR